MRSSSLNDPPTVPLGNVTVRVKRVGVEVIVKAGDESAQSLLLVRYVYIAVFVPLSVHAQNEIV